MVDLIQKYRLQLLELCRKYDVLRLDLFGSAAREDFDPDRSDLDFLVQFNNFTIHNAADRYFDFLFDLETLLAAKWIWFPTWQFEIPISEKRWMRSG